MPRRRPDVAPSARCTPPQKAMVFIERLHTYSRYTAAACLLSSCWATHVPHRFWGSDQLQGIGAYNLANMLLVDCKMGASPCYADLQQCATLDTDGPSCPASITKDSV